MVLRVAPTYPHATWCRNKLQKPRYRRSQPRGIKANKLYTECPSTLYTNMTTLHSTSENKPVARDLDSTHHQMVRTVLVSCHSVAFTQRRHLPEKPPFVRKLLANQNDRDVHGATELTMLPRSVKHMPRNNPSEQRTSQDLPILNGHRVTTTKACCDGAQTQT